MGGIGAACWSGVNRVEDDGVILRREVEEVEEVRSSWNQNVFMR